MFLRPASQRCCMAWTRLPRRSWETPFHSCWARCNSSLRSAGAVRFCLSKKKKKKKISLMLFRVQIGTSGWPVDYLILSLLDKETNWSEGMECSSVISELCIGTALLEACNNIRLQDLIPAIISSSAARYIVERSPMACVDPLLHPHGASSKIRRFKNSAICKALSATSLDSDSVISRPLAEAELLWAQDLNLSSMLQAHFFGAFSTASSWAAWWLLVRSGIGGYNVLPAC